MASFCYRRLFKGTETVSCRLSLRMAWMEIDWNLKKLANFWWIVTYPVLPLVSCRTTKSCGNFWRDSSNFWGWYNSIDSPLKQLKVFLAYQIILFPDFQCWFCQSKEKVVHWINDNKAHSIIVWQLKQYRVFCPSVANHGINLWLTLCKSHRFCMYSV